MSRTCGDCVVCCTLLSIKALDKPRCKNCEHLTLPRKPKAGEMELTGKHPEGNCSIYAERPSQCQKYECLWVTGHGQERDRPDRSLILGDHREDISGAIVCHEVAPGAADTREGIMTIVRLSRSTGMPVLIDDFYRDKMRVVGRPA